MTERSTTLVGAAAIAGSLAVGLTSQWDPVWLVVGVAAIGLAAGWFRDGHGLVAVPVAAAGGWLVQRAALDDSRPRWMVMAGVLAAVAFAAGIGTGPRAGISRRVLAAALALTCGGIFACVPETDAPGRTLFVVGIAAGVAALIDRVPSEEILAAGSAMALYAGLFGGQYRATAVVGAIGCFGLLGVSWLGAFVPRRDLVPGGLAGELFLVTVHALLMAVASRVAGRGAGVARAVVIEVMASVVGVLALASRHKELSTT
jgi:hypothetical protein